MQFIVSFAVVSLLSAFAAQAAPATTLEQRDVYAPPILTPKLDDVWVVGEETTVTWDVSSPPKNITNPIASLLLRKDNQFTPVVLAGNFDILDGQASFTVPQVVAGHDYSVNLFGDSGDWSAQFTIESPFSF